MTQSVSAQEVQAAGGLERWVRKIAQAPAPTVAKNATVHKESLSVPQAKGRLPDPLLGYDVDRMNGLEARYAGYLEAQRKTGKIALWKFEAMKLRLADGTFYTPDFFIMQWSGAVGFHETKGFWRDDARAKIKMAAELFPWFFFVAVAWDSKAKLWKFESFRDKGVR